MSEENERLYEETQRRLREVTTLYEASQACLSISDRKGLLTAIIEAAARATDAAVGSVMLIDEGKGEYVFGAHYGLSEETIAAIEAELHIPLGEGLVGSVVTTVQPLVVADVTTDPRWVPTEMKEPMHSFLGVPLVGKDGQPLGALTLACPEVGAFDEDHARLLSAFANQAALAIENARWYEQAQARSRYLETLQRINATLRSTLPLSQVLETIVQGTGQALNYVASFIIVPDATGERLTLGAVWGSRFLDAAVKFTGLEVASFSLPLTAEENPMAKAYLRGELYAWSGAPERIVVGVEPPISPKLAPVIERAMGARLAVCVPLPVGEKIAGVLVVFSPREHLPDEERAMLLGLADQAGLAIENARLYEQARQEIAERKRAIGALRESEDRYRRLVELFFDAIVIYSEGKVVYINAAGAELFGASSPEELVGKPILDFVHPDYLEIVEARMRRVAEGKVASLIEEKLIRLDGTSVDAEVVRIPITYQGQPAAQVVARDITQRKQAEEAYRALVEHSLQGLAILQGTSVVFANPAITEMLGYTVEELMSLSSEELRAVVHPEDQAFVWGRFRDRLEGKSVPPRYEFGVMRKDGAMRWVEMFSSLIEYGGKPAIQAALLDITERKRAEEALRESELQYRTTIDAMGDAIHVVDTDLQFILFNMAFKRWNKELGLETDVIGRTVFEVFPFLPDKVRDEYRQVFDTGKTLITEESTKLGDKEFVTETRKVPVLEGGRVTRIVTVIRDITGRKRAEEALRESEEKFRNLAEQSPSMIFINKKGRVVYANKKCEEIMGYKRKEFYSPDFDFFTLIAPEYIDLIQASFSRHIGDEDVSPYEYALITKEGRRIEAIITTKLIRYEGESAILGIVTDITERVQAEERIRESEEKFRNIFESVTDCLIYLDRSGRILEVNEKAVQVFGGSKEELLGKHFTKLGVVSLKDMPTIVRGFASALAGKDPSVYVCIKNKKGQEIPLDCTTALVKKEDRVAGAIVIARDVTERERLLTALKHRSTQLQTAAEVSKSASTILDPEELMNQAVNLIQERFAFYYVGLFLVDEAGEYAVLQAGTGEAGRQMLAVGHRLAVGGESMIGWSVANTQARIALDVDKEVLHFDNPYLPETRSEMALPLISHGQCIGALTVQSTEEAAFSEEDTAVLQTMADQLAIAMENARLYKQIQRYAAGLEERVAERTAELTAVNKELEAFAYSVSHDLRAPLRSIDGFSRAILEDYADRLDADGQDYFRRVRAASQRMGQLIDDLLKLSRVTRVGMRRETVNLSGLAQTIAAELQEIQPERQVEFVIAEGLIAYGDTRLLRVVLENLLGNAWKFTSKHPRARIEFGVTQVEGKPAYFVRDDGAGFDMAYADKLFGAFQRLHSMTEFEGTGIGLATVQRIIHRHGGRVWAEGVVEQGASFYFTL